MREKLIKFLVKAEMAADKNGFYNCNPNIEKAKFIADHLIANGVTIQKWIPVTERLPGFEIERVLVMTKGDLILGYPQMDTDRYRNGRWVRYGDNVTHWMPLPEPPKE